MKRSLTLSRAEEALAAAAGDLASIAVEHKQKARHLRARGARPARIQAEERAAALCEREAQRLIKVACARTEA